METTGNIPGHPARTDLRVVTSKMSVGPVSQTKEYDQFRELAQGLLQVPHKDVTEDGR